MSERRFTPESTIVACSHVLDAAVDQETVLLEPKAGAYFGLNAVSTRIWQMMASPVTLQSLHAALLADFEVDADVLWADIERHVAELCDNGLAEEVREPSRSDAGKR